MSGESDVGGSLRERHRARRELSTRLARAYFALQGLAVIAWWGLLLARPDWQRAFALHDAPPSALLAFAPGDVAIIGAGSLVVALRRPGRRAMGALTWLVAGATLYAACYTIVAAVSGAASPLGAAAMTPAALLSLVAASSLSRATHRALPPRRSGDSGP